MFLARHGSVRGEWYERSRCDQSCARFLSHRAVLVLVLPCVFCAVSIPLGMARVAPEVFLFFMGHLCRLIWFVRAVQQRLRFSM